VRSKDRVESTLKADRTLKGMDWIYLAQARVLWRVVNTVSIKRCGISWLAEVLLASEEGLRWSKKVWLCCLYFSREIYKAWKPSANL